MTSAINRAEAAVPGSFFRGSRSRERKRGGGAPNAADVRDSALAFLAGHSQTRLELRRRLLRKGFSPDEIGPCLDGLVRDGYVNDASTASAFVASRAKKGRGRARIAAELGARGVSRADADAALNELDSSSERAALYAALAKKERSLPTRLTPALRSKKLFDHLVRRGFSPSAVLEALKRKGEDE